jgi:hypothetical protein
LTSKEINTMILQSKDKNVVQYVFNNIILELPDVNQLIISKFLLLMYKVHLVNSSIKV